MEQLPTFSTHFCTPFSKGSDLSPDQIENAKEFVKPAIGTKEHNPLRFIVSDTQSFQNERKYDLVISSEVLMHVLPSEIEKVMI